MTNNLVKLLVKPNCIGRNCYYNATIINNEFCCSYYNKEKRYCTYYECSNQSAIRFDQCQRDFLND